MTVFDWALTIAAISWAFSIAEMVATVKLWPALFRLGPVVYRRDLPAGLPPAGTMIDRRELVGSGCYSFPTRTLCRFTSARSMFTRAQQSSLPLKGEIVWDAGKVTAIGRMPAGILVFTAAWLMAWTSGAINWTQRAPLLGIGIVVLGWFVIGAIVIRFVRDGRRNLEKMLDGLLPKLGVPGTPVAEVR